jgi:hypothetical protein
LKNKIFTTKVAIISFCTKNSAKAIGREYKKPNQPFQNHSKEKFLK